MSHRAYQDAERFLLGLVNYEVKPPPMRRDEEGWHLRDFARMLQALGNPQNAAPILHIAGTKGKGSTTRMCVALLSAVGYRRVGSFISPHIASFRERICIDNRPVSETAFVKALRAVRRTAPIGSPEGFRTTFEVLTAMALWTCRERRSEAIVLETGLGGRLDATNVPVNRVAAITAIGLDHQKVLGHTLREIAGEKAGIVKPGTRIAIVGPQLPRRRRIVREVAEDHARRARAPLSVCDEEADPSVSGRARPWGFEILLRNREGDTATTRLHALGRHQVDNLRTALAAVEAFGKLDGKPLDIHRADKAIRALRLPGRCEVWSEEPTVVLDAAHCPLSARATARACSEHFGDRPIVAVLGLLFDKNTDATIRALAKTGRIEHIRTYAPPTPRACEAHITAQSASRYVTDTRACDSVDEAVQQALSIVSKRPETLLLVTGTFYGLAPARRALETRLPQTQLRPQGTLS